VVDENDKVENHTRTSGLVGSAKSRVEAKNRKADARKNDDVKDNEKYRKEQELENGVIYQLPANSFYKYFTFHRQMKARSLVQPALSSLS
jgi:hypothetical protein